MSGMDETRARVQQMREKAQDLQQAADRTNDPQESERLKEKARKLQDRSEQESSMGSGDIHPSL